MIPQFTFRPESSTPHLLFRSLQSYRYPFAPVGVQGELVGYGPPETLRVAKLFDVTSRGEVLELDVSDWPEAAFYQDGDCWKVSIVTVIGGLKSSFEATYNPQTNVLRTAGSIRGYALK